MNIILLVNIAAGDFAKCHNNSQYPKPTSKAVHCVASKIHICSGPTLARKTFIEILLLAKCLSSLKKLGEFVSSLCRKHYINLMFIVSFNKPKPSNFKIMLIIKLKIIFR